jgi:amidophosphoribosyltransferase
VCGIVGISSDGEVWQELLESLIHLQHRGQDAAGICTADEKFHTHKGKGLVREVFSNPDIKPLSGNLGIAHVRYPTHGSRSEDEIQPFWTSSSYGVSLAHNGTLVNYSALKQELNRSFYYHLNTDSDSELLLHLFANKLNQSHDDDNKDFFTRLGEAMSFIYDYVIGAYSVVCTIIGQGLCAFRDPHGIRPLVIGVRERARNRKDYIVASETTMFHPLGYKVLGDVLPGELIFIDGFGKLQRKQILAKSFRPCVFEYVYFARPDALLNDVSVYRSRLRMGQNLASKWMETYPGLLPDVVIPVPFSSNTSALAFANALGVRYTEGLYKNPFIGRTFIMSNQAKRKRSVRQKLSPQETEIRGKNVLLLDDSIVRGTTSKEIVSMVRENGAKKVYFASACPMVKHPCFYGIDMPTKSELIAHNKNQQEIAEYLNVDKLLYQSIEGLCEAVTRRGEHKIEKPCLACLDGQYVCSTGE